MFLKRPFKKPIKNLKKNKMYFKQNAKNVFSCKFRKTFEWLYLKKATNCKTFKIKN